MENKLPNCSETALAAESKAENKTVNKPVVSTKVKRRTNMKSLLRQTFIPEDVSDAKDYILVDLIMPAIKNGIFDTVLNIIDYWRGGGGSYRRPGNTVAPRPRAAQPYDYSNRSRVASGVGPSISKSDSSSRYSYEDVLLEDYPSNNGGSARARAEAEMVLQMMQDTINRYSFVRISDFYDFVGLTGNPSDYNYGWISIENATVRRGSGGWYFVLPKAMPIDNI